VHNGLPTLAFLDRSEARQKLNLPQDAFVVGSIGELTLNKNYAQLIRAIAILKEKVADVDFILDVIGGGEERETLEIEKNRNTFVERRVKLEGFKENAFAYLSAYDAFVLPSLKEGLPYVLLEAGQAGLPVIASNVGGIPDIVEHEKTGLLVDPEDTEGLADMLSLLMKNRDLQKRYGTALQDRVQKNFSLETMIEKTTDVYKLNS